MVNVPPIPESSQTFMKSSKKFYPNTTKVYDTSRQFSHPPPPLPIKAEMVDENLIVETVTPPAIAVVAPTARNPSGHSSSCAMSVVQMNKSGVQQQMAPPPRNMHHMPTQHVQHHIHHIQPVQLSQSALSPPPQLQATTLQQQQQPPPGAWPVLEPAFHFGPGFEVHQSYCPAHSHGEPSQHIVLFHLLHGVAVSFQIAGGRKIIQGPVTVPMVSQSGSPPIPMPVQVPPGHVMQQIVDENGTLRHVILSTAQHQQGGVQGVQHHIHGHYLSANGSAPHYYNPIPPAPGYQSANPTGPGGTTHFHQPIPLQSQAQQMSAPNNNNSNNNTSYQKNDRAQRVHQKLKATLETRQQLHGPVNRSTNNNSNNINNNNNNNNNNISKSELNGTSGRRTLQRNGTSSGGSVGGGASSVGTSDDGEESSSVPDEEDDVHQVIIDYLSAIESPGVKEIESHRALVTWAPPQASPTENVLVNGSDLRYEILLGDRGKDGKYKSIFRGTNLSCVIQDLRAGQEYHVCLLVHYLDSLHGAVSEPVVFKTPAREPDAPLQPKVITRTKNALQLRWNAPTDNGSHIIHYVVECSSEMSPEFVEICKIKGKQFTVSKLVPATWYSFRLAAVNDCGRSEYSETCSFSTAGNPPTAPPPPVCHKTSSSSLALVWNRRNEDGDFLLQMLNREMLQQGYLNVYFGPDTAYECTRLQRATAYQFRMRSETEAGQSQWSPEVTYLTQPERPGKSSKPIVKGKIHANSFKVKWDAPNDRGGADIKLYHLEIRSGAVFERIYTGAENEASCDRLNPGTTYQIRVICEGPGGISAASDIGTVTTEAIVPNPPQTPYYSNQPGPYAAVLQWEKPLYQGGAPVTEYELQLEGVLNQGAEKTMKRELVYRGKDAYCVVKDLLPGESYVTQVRALNRIGAGSWSEEFIFKAGSAPPCKPLAAEITIKSPTHLCIQWQEPQCNGAPITDYKLESSLKQNEDDTFSVVYEGVEQEANLMDLLPYTTYYFRFHAINSAGRSPNSPIVTQMTPASVPSPPTLLPDLFNITYNSAHIFWLEPECHGSPITNYIVECGDKMLTTETNQTDLVVSPLNAEQVYKVKVQAVNNIGCGGFTQSMKFTTKPLPPKPPRLECIQYGYNSLKFKWGSDGAVSSSSKLMDFQRFYVDMKIKNSSKDYQNIYTGTRNSFKVQKLHESTLYAFRICAQTDHAGIGGYSDEYLFKTQAAQPNGVKIVRCIENYPVISSSNNDSNVTQLPTLTVEWQHSKNNHFHDAIEYILQKTTAPTGNIKNLEFDEIYRGSETRHTIDGIDYDTDYSLRVIPVRAMKSKRTTSLCSTSTRTTSSSHDDIDDVDGRGNVDDDDSDDSDEDSDDETYVKKPVYDQPVTYEYVYGTASSVVHYKLPKVTEPLMTSVASTTTTTTIISNHPTNNRKNVKFNANSKLTSSTPHLSAVNKKHQQLMDPTTSTNVNEVSNDTITESNKSPFLRFINRIKLFYFNRHQWSDNEKALVGLLVIMLIAVIVGCFLQLFV